MLRGEVDGHLVQDIQLDTGCSRTVVRSDLVDKMKTIGGETVTIQCAHGDITTYPVATVEIQVNGKQIVVEAAVSDTLPRSVLLGTDVQELSELLGQPSTHKDSGFAVLTRNRARQQKQEDKERQHKERESGATPTTLESIGQSKVKEQNEEKQEVTM